MPLRYSNPPRDRAADRSIRAARGTMPAAHGVTIAFWEYRAKGTIWKVVPAARDLLVGEERNTGEKTVSFFCVGLEDGSLRWSGLRMEEAWWVGIETTHRGVLFLHQYPVPSMPDHRKIFAVDASSGRRLWENHELAFSHAREDSVYGSRDLFDRRLFYELELATGRVVREVSPADLGPQATAWEVEVQVPQPLETIPPAVAETFARGTEIEPGESLVHAGMQILSCYEVTPAAATGRTMRELLFAIEPPGGAVRHRDTVCEGLSLPAGASFFRAGGRIVYVRDRTALRSFAVAQEQRR